MIQLLLERFDLGVQKGPPVLILLGRRCVGLGGLKVTRTPKTYAAKQHTEHEGPCENAAPFGHHSPEQRRQIYLDLRVL